VWGAGARPPPPTPQSPIPNPQSPIKFFYRNNLIIKFLSYIKIHKIIKVIFILAII